MMQLSATKFVFLVVLCILVQSIAGCARTDLVAILDDGVCATVFDSSGNNPTLIYRSVGPQNTAPLATGATNMLSLDDWCMANFTQALPDEVGVGDILQFNDRLAVIHGRRSNTRYVLADIDGAPLNLSTVTTTDWKIFRAYTSLADALVAEENIGIAARFRNFDTWSQSNPKDLVAENQQWNIACYGDAADTAGALIEGWISGPSNYLKIFSPNNPSQVGVTQRHAGRWTTSNTYRIEVSEQSGLRNAVDFVRIEGVQVGLWTKDPGSRRGTGIINEAPCRNGDSEVFITDNIVWGRFELEGNAEVGIGSTPACSAATVWVRNNLVYGFVDSVAGAAAAQCYNVNSGRSRLYNNTAYACEVGIVTGSGAGTLMGDEVLMNNLVQSNPLLSASSYVGYVFIDGGIYANNISMDATSPNAAFTNKVAVFIDAQALDFHLSPSDTVAQGFAVDLTDARALADTAGISLSLATDLALDSGDDIDGNARTTPWDIGADEL